MLNEHYDVTTAAYAVGFESLSHFSREYSRMFEESPKRDITIYSHINHWSLLTFPDTSLVRNNILFSRCL
ncbi:putative fimbrial operon transcriptional regulator [Escherichia coli]|nr:putative fimbrial operon transcriptional regulator [Escherichia coli]